MTKQKATNITWHQHEVKREALKKLHGHKGATIWFTGLSGSGKSTLANAVAASLHDRKVSTFILDGDSIRDVCAKELDCDVGMSVTCGFRMIFHSPESRPGR